MSAGLSKGDLCFDPSDTADLDNYDNTGAFIRGNAGDVITSRELQTGEEHLDVYAALADKDGLGLSSTDLGGGVRALKVDIGDSVEIETKIDGDYDVSTNATPDSAGLIAHDRAAAPDQTNQNFRSTGANPAASVDPANVHALDVNSFMMAFDGTDWERLEIESGRLKVDIDSSSPIPVKECYDSWANKALAVATTATQIAASPLTDRCELTIQNLSSKDVYLGEGSGVTAANGIMIGRKSSATFKMADGADPYLIRDAGAGTSDIRIYEAA